MKVLSLFDGISCGMLAFERAGIPVERYVAFEIDENAIKVSNTNYPQIEQMGDVFEADFSAFKGFDVLVGGSPCTYWSIARSSVAKGGKRETTASGLGWDLFSQYVRALKEAEPRWFLYENNASMSNEIKECITQELGCEPIEIDSADFSAQIRKRLYWTNIPIAQWQKSELQFKDIMDAPDSDFLTRDISKYAETIKWSRDGKTVKWDTSGKGYYSQASRAKLVDQKWNTVCANRAESKGNVWLGDNTIRLVTMSELEKLQTLPEGYTACLTNKEQRGKCIGNGWTVDVIAHIFKGIIKEGNNMELKITDVQFPKAIDFNFEELKTEISSKVEMYKNIVYTDATIKDAKSDKAALNKFVKALEDKRKAIKKECLQPYEEFEAKIKELVRIVSEPVALIDSQVKDYEQRKKDEKLEQIKAYWDTTNHPEWLTCKSIFDSRWLNATASMKSIKEAIDGRLADIDADLKTLGSLTEFSFEAIEEYKRSLDVNKAITEGQRLAMIQKRKQETEERAKQTELPKPEPAAEQPKAEPTPAPVNAEEPAEDTVKTWIKFEAEMTVEQALKLKAFFEAERINFRPLI